MWTSIYPDYTQRQHSWAFGLICLINGVFVSQLWAFFLVLAWNRGTHSSPREDASSGVLCPNNLFLSVLRQEVHELNVAQYLFKQQKVPDGVRKFATILFVMPLHKNVQDVRSAGMAFNV